jgi:hypothetical protein
MRPSPPVPQMQTRSWYISADIADQLAAVVDDIHWRTRRPKHEVLAAALGVAIEHQTEIVDRLARPGGAS